MYTMNQKEHITSPFDISVYLLTAAFLAAITVLPDRVSAYAKSGIILWYKNILPVMLPFLTASVFAHEIGLSSLAAKLLSKPCRKLSGLSGYGIFALICAVLSGYPAGAKITGSLIREGKVTADEGKKILLLCDVTSPAFIIGTVGSNMFGDKKVGILILICHYISALIMCLMYKVTNISRSQIQLTEKNSVAAALSNAACSASQTLISVCCLVTFFSVICGLTEDLGLLPSAFIGENPTADGSFVSLIEMTNGCRRLSFSGSPLNICAACAAINFGGLCIFFQISDALKGCHINGTYVLSMKIMHAVLGTLLFVVLCFLSVIAHKGGFVVDYLPDGMHQFLLGIFCGTPE